MGVTQLGLEIIVREGEGRECKQWEAPRQQVRACGEPTGVRDFCPPGGVVTGGRRVACRRLSKVIGALEVTGRAPGDLNVNVSLTFAGLQKSLAGSQRDRERERKLLWGHLLWPDRGARRLGNGRNMVGGGGGGQYA